MDPDVCAETYHAKQLNASPFPSCFARNEHVLPYLQPGILKIFGCLCKAFAMWKWVSLFILKHVARWSRWSRARHKEHERTSVTGLFGLDFVRARMMA